MLTLNDGRSELWQRRINICWRIMDNFCVCCGDIIPEGRMVCPICEMEADETETAILL